MSAERNLFKLCAKFFTLFFLFRTLRNDKSIIHLELRSQNGFLLSAANVYFFDRFEVSFAKPSLEIRHQL